VARYTPQTSTFPACFEPIDSALIIEFMRLNGYLRFFLFLLVLITALQCYSGSEVKTSEKVISKFIGYKY
jgi:hypothetical protein